MLIGSVLAALVTLLAFAGLAYWSVGAQLASLMKMLLGGGALLLALVGAAVVSTDLLTSSGYLDSGNGQQNRQGAVTQTVKPAGTEALTEEEMFRWNKEVHDKAVQIFITASGFGFSRLRPSLDDIITHPPTSQSGDLTNNNPTRDFQLSWGFPLLESMPHYTVQNQMVEGLAQVRVFNQEESNWRVRNVHLIGLIKHPEPVVYITDKAPVMFDKDEVNNVPIRELDAFEKAALTAIRNGANLKVEEQGKTMRMVGPIFAGQACMKCHEQKGQLLGLFTYRLEKVQPKKPQPTEELPE